MKRGSKEYPLILLYHRIEDLPSDPQHMCVRRDHFAEQLAVLRDSFRLVSLSTAVEAAGKREMLADRHVAVTFDDGYADNLYNAKPLLQEYEVPATVFVTSDYVDSGREFWWDELERLLLEPGLLPEVLELELNQNVMRWTLGDHARYDMQSSYAFREWTLRESEDPTIRHTIYRDLLSLLRDQPDPTRQAVLAQLRSVAQAREEARPTHRPLTGAELQSLAGDLVEVGAHTRTHPVLSGLSIMDQWREIAGGARQLSERIGRRPSAFAYPYGWHGQYARATVALVRSLGFKLGCSAFPPWHARSHSRFELPRLVVYDCDGDTFARDVVRLM
jgi:peptidoglycan/xylan/chitin deacetylase (PgdA/CDA1 family)